MSQILYTRRAAWSHQASAAPSNAVAAPPSRPQGSPDSGSAEISVSPAQSQAAARAREFAAELFRHFQDGGGGGEVKKEEDEKNEREEGSLGEGRSCLAQTSPSRGCPSLPQRSAQVASPASSSSSPSSPSAPSSAQEASASEPGYVNYSRLHYRLQQPGAAEQNTGGEEGTHRFSGVRRVKRSTVLSAQASKMINSSSRLPSPT